MKVVLTRPNYPTHLITPPLGLGYLSAYLNSKKIDTQIIDGLNLGLSNRELVRLCLRAEVVGISILSFYLLAAVDLAKRLKKMGKIVIIGGPQVTALPALSLNLTQADYAVVGEGEMALAALIKVLEKAKPRTKIWRRPFIKNLSDLPWPDWEQMNPGSYQKAPHGGVIKNFPVAPIMTTRGCPYECYFCASPKLWQRQIRYRRPAEVVEEIKYLVNNFGVKEIHIEDDNFTLKREHAEDFCHRLIRGKIKISWATPNGIRADKVDLPLLRLMKKAGCYFVAFGIESGNQEILNRIAKHSNLQVIKKAVGMAHQAGLITQGFFIFGLPGETAQTITNTINFAKSLPLDKAQFLYLDVIPGSKLWDDLNFNRKVDWKLDSFHQVSWLPPTVDKLTLAQAQSRAFREFFLRPSQVLTMLKLIKPGQLKYVIKRIKDFDILNLKLKT
jgi:radical SAM superfamily enzyme YgiQ (UPF0313 family)